MKNWWFYVLVVVAFVALTYFMSIRPHNKSTLEKFRKNSKLKVGDRIMTIGGFYAVIAEKNEVYYIIELEPDGTRMRISPEAVAVYPEDIARSEALQKEMNSKLEKYK